jgi:hypothetical protein
METFGNANCRRWNAAPDKVLIWAEFLTTARLLKQQWTKILMIGKQNLRHSAREWNLVLRLRY